MCIYTHIHTHRWVPIVCMYTCTLRYVYCCLARVSCSVRSDQTLRCVHLSLVRFIGLLNTALSRMFEWQDFMLDDSPR